MIVTSCKPYGVIGGMLKKWKKTGIVSCNSCARVCETGGRTCMKRLSKRLTADGFIVVDEDLIPMACNIALVKKRECRSKLLQNVLIWKSFVFDNT